MMMQSPSPTSTDTMRPRRDVRSGVVAEARARLAAGDHPTALEVADAVLAHLIAWRGLLGRRV
jgi:hypothetical protein